MPRTKVIVATTALVAAIPLAAWTVGAQRPNAQAADVRPATTAHVPANPVDARRRADFAAMQNYRPGYAFWQHVFTLPDHSIAFGSAVDGRLLVTFPDERELDAAGGVGRSVAGPHPRRATARSQTRVTAAIRWRVLLEARRRAGPAQLDAWRCPAAERQQVRSVSRRVGRDLRAVRCARGHRSGAGHSRIGPERYQALGSQRRRLLPVAAAELEAAELLLSDADRGEEPDDAGSLLRRVPVRARHQVRIVHPRAVRAQRRRHERGADADQRRAPRRRRRPRPILSGLEAGPRPARAAGQGIRGRLSELWSRARISMRRWSSATRSSSGT